MQVLRGVGDERLALATQENLFALFRAMVSSLDGELVERHDLRMHHVTAMNPMFRGVWAPHLTDEDVEEAVDEALAWFAERDAPFFFWWIGPGAMPTDLGARLTARGFRSMAEQSEEFPGIKASERGSPCMVADLAAMNEGAIGEVPDGFIIEPVRDEDDLAAFADVLVDAMTIPPPIADAWTQAARVVGIGHTPWRMYVGRLEGKVVATNMLFNGAGVASVYGVATRPAYRGRGIGGAITLAPLLEARGEGYEHAVLFSSLEGVNAYERIGFRRTSTWIDRFLWMRPD